MLDLSLPAAELISIVISSFLYGVYLTTLGMTGRVLLMKPSGRRRRLSEMNWIVVGVCVLLFINVTVDISMGLVLVMQAFVSYTGPGGSAQAFTHVSGWQTFTKSFCVGLQSLTGDAILIYRCWYLWHKSWAIIGLPVVVWLADLACHIGLMITLSEISQGLINNERLLPWGRSFWALTICTNISVTSLIVARIWRVERENKRFRPPRDPDYDQPRTTLGRAMRNIIESGMIYTTATILLFAAYTTQSTLTYPASVLEIHSVGITFNLIIVRGARRERARPNSMIVTPLQFSQGLAANIGDTTTTAVGEGKSEVFVLSRLEPGSSSRCVRDS